MKYMVTKMMHLWSAPEHSKFPYLWTSGHPISPSADQDLAVLKSHHEGTLYSRSCHHRCLRWVLLQRHEHLSLCPHLQWHLRAGHQAGRGWGPLLWQSSDSLPGDRGCCGQGHWSPPHWSSPAPSPTLPPSRSQDIRHWPLGKQQWSLHQDPAWLRCTLGIICVRWCPA